MEFKSSLPVLRPRANGDPWIPAFAGMQVKLHEFVTQFLFLIISKPLIHQFDF
jgi:hypothetical protein